MMLVAMPPSVLFSLRTPLPLLWRWALEREEEAAVNRTTTAAPPTTPPWWWYLNGRLVPQMTTAAAVVAAVAVAVFLTASLATTREAATTTRGRWCQCIEPVPTTKLNRRVGSQPRWSAHQRREIPRCYIRRQAGIDDCRAAARGSIRQCWQAVETGHAGQAAWRWRVI